MTQRFDRMHPQVHKDSLAALMEAFAERQSTQGYTRASMKASIGLIKGFIAWLEQRVVERSGVSIDHVAEYLTERWLHRRRRRGDAFTLRSFVDFCAADSTVLHTDAQTSTTSAHRVRQDFERYLRGERGLAEATIRLYGDAVGRFLQDVFGVEDARLGTLTAADIVRFVQTEAARLNHAKRAKVM